MQIDLTPPPLSDPNNERGASGSLEPGGGSHPTLRSDQRALAAVPNSVFASIPPDDPPLQTEPLATARCRHGHLLRASRAFLSGSPCRGPRELLSPGHSSGQPLLRLFSISGDHRRCS